MTAASLSAQESAGQFVPVVRVEGSGDAVDRGAAILQDHSELRREALGELPRRGVQESAGGLARVVGPALGGALFGIGVSIPYLVAAAMTLLAMPLVPTGRRPLAEVAG